MKTIESLSLNALQHVLRSIRKNTPATSFSVDRAASSDIRTGYLDGSPVRRLVITFRAPGCSWVSRSGGCTMCGHYAGTTQGILPSPDETVAQFTSEIAAYDLDTIKVLSLYNSGSMLNPEEFHPSALTSIFRIISRHQSIRKVVLETRAEFVDPEYIDALKSILGDGRSVSIAMGLETSDDFLREICLNKGCTRDDIANVVQSLKGIAETQLYVLSGIPFLTESEAIEDTVCSIRYAHALGADEIHIEPVTLQKHTLIEHLVASGHHRLLSLYSIYEILRRVVPDIRPYVSPFMHMPLPDRIPGGCPECSRQLVVGLLDAYNINRDRVSLGYPQCACISDWRNRLNETDARPVHQRLTDALEAMSYEAAL